MSRINIHHQLSMSRVKISVIVPVYNAETYLRRCVDSILAQTFTDFELLLVDDGSTDASGKICDEYASADARVRVFHKPNGGVSSARNLGLDNARGEWIAFADSDDYVDCNWLDSMAPSTDKDCDLSCCGFHLHNGTDVAVTNKGINFRGSNADLVDKLSQIGMIGVLWNKLFRRSIIIENGLRLDERFIYREDEEFFFRYLVFCKECTSAETPTYHYNEPDWMKYKSQTNASVSYYLLASINTSCSKMMLDNGSGDVLREELDNLLLFALRKNPLKALGFISEYKLATNKPYIPICWMIMSKSLKKISLRIAK